MSSSDSWSSERVKIELEDTLENLDRLENHLPEPLTLTESIDELETTLALYDQLTDQGTLHGCSHCRSQTDRYDGATAGLKN